MMTRQQKERVKLIKATAKELRVAGYKARADYYMCEVVIKGIDDNEWFRLQNLYEDVCLLKA